MNVAASEATNVSLAPSSPAVVDVLVVDELVVVVVVDAVLEDAVDAIDPQLLFEQPTS